MKAYNRDMLLETIALDLSKLCKKEGRYLRTWANGIEERSPAYYDPKEIEMLVTRAKKVLKRTKNGKE